MSFIFYFPQVQHYYVHLPCGINGVNSLFYVFFKLWVKYSQFYINFKRKLSIFNLLFNRKCQLGPKIYSEFVRSDQFILIWKIYLIIFFFFFSLLIVLKVIEKKEMANLLNHDLIFLRINLNNPKVQSIYNGCTVNSAIATDRILVHICIYKFS